MTLTSLLVCPDKAAASLLRGVLEDLKLDVEVCENLERASVRLLQERFDALVLDCESLQQVRTLLTDTEAARQQNGTLTVAILQNQDNLRELFALGANFVIYKPVTRERAVNSLRAARALMRKERRGGRRAPVHAHVSIDYANAEKQKATLVDLAEDGLAMHFGKKLPPSGKVYFQFQLPGQNSTVRLSGQVMWQDWNGRAGIQFKDVPQTSRRLLRDWLQLSASKPQGPAPTVELQTQISFGGGMVPAEHDEAETMEIGGDSRSAPASTEEYFADPGDRRGVPRYACRIGAEVFQKGSNVRNFCNLSDVGPGGCYLEMPMAFSVGTVVEITLRSGELKVQVGGRVQSSHPGYGMGVSFLLESKSDKERVQQLIDIVAAAVKAES